MIKPVTHISLYPIELCMGNVLELLMLVPAVAQVMSCNVHVLLSIVYVLRSSIFCMLHHYVTVPV